MAKATLKDYTVPIEDGMRVRHDAKARFIVKSSRRILEDHLTSADSLGGLFTTLSYKYNARSLSGGTLWRHPTTGELLTRPRIVVYFRPDDVLTGDQECNCERCVNE